VLRNYTTYKTFWKIEKAIQGDPEYDTKLARRAIARFISLHPHQLAQKAEIIVEHFRQNTAAKIAGQAKAMVVTSSRLHAVRYKGALDRYIKQHAYPDLTTLIAFSGRVLDGAGSFTEQGMNGFPESETARKFDGDDYQVMIVAEKFQTGFDQPKLHTMYVDKVLVGLAAVQTLSRLNRIHPMKEDTFVLDFRNETDDIVKAFEPYYGQTVAPPTDPNMLWDTRSALSPYDVLREDEILNTVSLLVGEGLDAKRHAAVYAALGPARERFEGMDGEARLEFKNLLNQFVRVYSFLYQIVPMGSRTLERDYTYCRALASYLRDNTTVEKLDLGSEVELTHLRNDMTFSGNLDLAETQGEVRWKVGEGKPSQYELELEKLSQIIDVLNERFGLELTDQDKLLFDQFEESWVADGELANQARNNTMENFKLAFDKKFLSTIVERMDENDAIFKRVIDDADFQAVLADFYLRKVYERLADPARAPG
jgi:type I restriction enzyme R subunit